MFAGWEDQDTATPATACICVFTATTVQCVTPVAITDEVISVLCTIFVDYFLPKNIYPILDIFLVSPPPSQPPRTRLFRTKESPTFLFVIWLRRLLAVGHSSQLVAPKVCKLLNLAQHILWPPPCCWVLARLQHRNTCHSAYTSPLQQMYSVWPQTS